MDHYKNPYNKGLTEDKNYLTTNLHNPSCGDDVTVQVLVEDKIVKDIRQIGKGCSICCSSASVMSVTLKGLEINKALKTIDSFYNLLMNKPYDQELLKGDALAYSGVGRFPARIGCATLPWKAIEALIIKHKENNNG